MEIVNKNNNLPLVICKNEQICTTSIDMANKFNKEHSDILIIINTLECPDSFRRNNFIQITQDDKEGYYLITRSGFSLAAMSFNDKEGIQWKIKYIESFDKMERLIKTSLNKRSEQDWIRVRTQSILPQRQKTDIIQKFIEYAKKQGSKGAHHYYENIQKMEYDALFEGGYKHLNLLSSYFKTSTALKDLLNIDQLFTLANADKIAEKALQEGMDLGLHYKKEIFPRAKEKVLAFVDLIGKDKVVLDNNLLPSSNQ